MSHTPASLSRMDHRELVARAARWLRGTRRCGVVLTEASGGHEQPDAIGWRLGGRHSILIECKTSRGDFLRDREKWHRRHESVRIGRVRYYMTPASLVRPDEVPGGWGLLEVDAAGRVRVAVEAVPVTLGADLTAREAAYLFSALRKAQCPALL